MVLKRKKITGAVFVDLSVAYDTVNLRRLKGKIYNIIKDFKLANMVETLLSNIDASTLTFREGIADGDINKMDYLKAVC